MVDSIQGQSKEDFFSCSSMPRNRELMRVFKDVGLVEQLGSGMSRILKEYDKSIFHISEHFIKVEFPFSLPKETIIIANGDDNGNETGNDNLEYMESYENIKRKSFYYGKTNEYKSKKGQSSYKRIKRKRKNCSDRI